MDNTAQAARSLRRTGKNDLCDSILERASTRWLKNAEILDLLTHYAEWDLGISTSPPHLPESGDTFLFDKRKERYFRRDEHDWKKKANGKTVRETHEKLKANRLEADQKVDSTYLQIDNAEVLNCYYTQTEDSSLQRRSYWTLNESTSWLVFVHYLDRPSTRAKDTPIHANVLPRPTPRPLPILNEQRITTPIQRPLANRPAPIQQQSRQDPVLQQPFAPQSVEQPRPEVTLESQLIGYFHESSNMLARHLEDIRRRDRQFLQDLLNLERERSAVDRDSVIAIAAAIIGHLTGLRDP